METCNQQKLIAKSSLLITDYSNIFFDFGYLGKPIIYTHFDYTEYRKYHFPNGYFDYERDGFGKVCYDSESTINAIISEIKCKMKMKTKYYKRIKRFFQYNDQLNCIRTYIKIVSHKNDMVISEGSNDTKVLNFFFAILIFFILKFINNKINIFN